MGDLAKKLRLHTLTTKTLQIRGAISTLRTRTLLDIRGEKSDTPNSNNYTLPQTVYPPIPEPEK